jgi:hypothetical protein
VYVDDEGGVGAEVPFGVVSAVGEKVDLLADDGGLEAWIGLGLGLGLGSGGGRGLDGSDAGILHVNVV